jgi:acetylornithine/succinyldiaminopimelate/putrescine aminotransferase
MKRSLALRSFKRRVVWKTVEVAEEDIVVQARSDKEADELALKAARTVAFDHSEIVEREYYLGAHL